MAAAEIMGTGSQHFWVQNRTDLDKLKGSLESSAALALDSESNSGFSYEERLCLLQINDGRSIWLLDLLALPGGSGGLEPLRKILEDPDHAVFLHGGEFDVGCLKRDYDIALAGVWDTQQAASFLGWEKTGYGAVVERLCDVVLPKAHTRHDWSQRPIEGEELQYAVSDVLYLPEIAAKLKVEVHRQDLDDEVEIACLAVEKATWNGGYKPEGLWTVKGARQLAEELQKVLMALYTWRESVARKLDLPPGRALNNQVLMALARNIPTRVEELRRLGVPMRIVTPWAAELLQVIRQARQDPPELPPAPTRQPLDRQLQKRGDRLKKWRREEAERRGVPMQVVLPLAAMRYIRQHGAADLELVPQLGCKRIRLYGETLLRLAATQP